jgi:hypothetical protein
MLTLSQTGRVILLAAYSTLTRRLIDKDPSRITAAEDDEDSDPATEMDDDTVDDMLINTLLTNPSAPEAEVWAKIQALHWTKIRTTRTMRNRTKMKQQRRCGHSCISQGLAGNTMLALKPFHKPESGWRRITLFYHISSADHPSIFRGQRRAVKMNGYSSNGGQPHRGGRGVYQAQAGTAEEFGVFREV